MDYGKGETMIRNSTDLVDVLESVMDLYGVLDVYINGEVLKSIDFISFNKDVNAFIVTTLPADENSPFFPL